MGCVTAAIDIFDGVVTFVYVYVAVGARQGGYIVGQVAAAIHLVDGVGLLSEGCIFRTCRCRTWAIVVGRISMGCAIYIHIYVALRCAGQVVAAEHTAVDGGTQGGGIRIGHSIGSDIDVDGAVDHSLGDDTFYVVIGIEVGSTEAAAVDVTRHRAAEDADSDVVGGGITYGTEGGAAINVAIDGRTCCNGRVADTDGHIALGNGDGTIAAAEDAAGRGDRGTHAAARNTDHDIASHCTLAVAAAIDAGADAAGGHIDGCGAAACRIAATIDVGGIAT